MWVSIVRLAGGLAPLLCLSLPFSVMANPSATENINLDQAVAQTLASNPQLQAFGYQLDIDRGHRQQAELAPNPELTVTVEDALGSGEYQGFDNAETTLSIGWVFERNIREHRASAALASESVTAVDIAILRVDSAAETARRFLEVLANQARAETSAAAVALAEQTVAAVQKRVEAGLAPGADLARARAELAYAGLTQEDNEHELATSRHLLAAQWGLTAPDFARADGNPYQLPATLPLPELQQRAEQNPEIQRYLAQQRLDEAVLRLAETQRKPGWRGSLGVRRYENVNDMALVTGFTIPLALKNRNQGNIAAAQAAADQTLAETAAAQVGIQTGLFVFHEALQHSLHRATTLRERVLPEIEQALEETRAAYESGRYSYFDWRAVQAELLAAQNELIDASVDAHRYVIEIERLAGVRFAQQGMNP
jgi:cobalt-zinc-cadmium efflux system outer membrane protein